MSNVPNSQLPIQIPATAYRAPVSESVMQQIGGAVNYLLDFAIPVGTIIHSMLTPAQFTNQIGSTDWILADGGSCVGTRYATLTGFTTVPDLRGIFLRGKNNGRSGSSGNPEGDFPLGTAQTDAVQNHSHTMQAHYLPEQGGPLVRDDGSNYAHFPANSTGVMNTGKPGIESRPRNVTVNIFIRVN